MLELIGQVGGREALMIVAAHARDAEPEIQDAATRALGNWMSVDAAPVLLDLAKTLSDAKLKTRALRGYLRIARQLDLPIDRHLEMCEEAFGWRKARREAAGGGNSRRHRPKSRQRHPEGSGQGTQRQGAA